MSESLATYSTRHPHEPEIPPALDSEGRCLVCGILVREEDIQRRLAQVEAALGAAVAQYQKALAEWDRQLPAMDRAFDHMETCDRDQLAARLKVTEEANAAWKREVDRLHESLAQWEAKAEATLESLGRERAT